MKGFLSVHQTMEYWYSFISWGYFYSSAGYLGYAKFHRDDISMSSFS